MPRKSLIAEQPWSGADARRGLVEASTCAWIDLGRERIGVVCEPLIRRDRHDQRLRAVRFDVPEALAPKIDPDDLCLVETDGTQISSTPVDSPEGSVRVLVPLAGGERPVLARVRTAEFEGEARVLLDVPREWTIHLVHHSHLDIGYTDPQPRIQVEQRSFIDSALDLVRASDDWPDDVKFRWTVESRWVADQWMKLRPRARVDEFVRRVREGRIELSALPYNVHLDTCSTDELHELLRSTKAIRDRYQLQLPSAMQTDVPGSPVGLPQVLNDAGVRYLSVAHNWAGRSMPHTNGGDNLPRLFRWRSHSGAEVLVWMTDSPHGQAYMEGPLLGFHDSFTEVDRLLSSYLYSVAHNPYPFPPGVFGWHGDPVSTRTPYPWDILHIRTQGFVGDNAPARLQAARIARQWNETWDWPRLRTSTNTAFFEDAEGRLSDQIQTFEGDWGDWWVEGVGSAALPQSIVREAQAKVTDAQFVSQAARLVGGAPNPDEATRRDASYQAISLFNEHTWGASNSWLASDVGMDSGGLQWHWKVAQALEAEEATEEFLEQSMAGLAEQIACSPSALETVLVLNTQKWTTSTTTTFLLREAAVPMTTSFAVIDARTGDQLPYTVIPQNNPTHREAGRWIRVAVPDIPGLGFVRLELHQSGTAGGESEATDVDAGLPGVRSARRPTEGLEQPGSRSEALALQNEYLRVIFDDARACITSIVELATGRELVNSDSVAGFNQYIYDEYTTAGGFNHQSNKSETGPKLELLGSRTVARPSVVLESVDDGVEQRLVVEFAAKGVEKARTTLRLRRGESLLRIENRLWKPTTRTKESAYFAFPFAIDDPTVLYEISGGLAGDSMEHIPGAPQHMRAIRNWVSLSSEERAVAWVTKDAPLVQAEAIALPYAPFPDSTTPREPATLFSWVHNNVWDTNFPIEQAFETTFEYAIGVPDHQGLTGVALAASSTAKVVHPPIALLAQGTEDDTSIGSYGELITVEDDRVQVVGVCETGSDEILVKLQSFAPEGVSLRVSLPGARIIRARRTCYLGETRENLAVHGDAAQISLEPMGVAAVAFGVGSSD